MKALYLAVLLAVACGGEDESSFTCEPSDRSGTYWAEFETLSGNCGPQDSTLIRPGETSSSSGGDTGCTELEPARWSDGNCTLETKGQCPLEGAPGVTVTMTMISEQKDGAGDVIDGTLSMVIEQYGEYACSGSYRMHAVRQ